MTPPAWYSPDNTADCLTQRRARRLLAAYLSDVSEYEFSAGWDMSISDLALAACDGRPSPLTVYAPTLRVLAGLAHGWVAWGPLKAACLLDEDTEYHEGVVFVPWETP